MDFCIENLRSVKRCVAYACIMLCVHLHTLPPPTPAIFLPADTTAQTPLCFPICTHPLAPSCDTHTCTCTLTSYVLHYAPLAGHRPLHISPTHSTYLQLHIRAYKAPHTHKPTYNFSLTYTHVALHPSADTWTSTRCYRHVHPYTHTYLHTHICKYPPIYTPSYT